ncbi:uncharacterized protein K444DRAFT_637527 [Hyaloscypha bicolor E]|uniref:DUF6594 domain-containing protein n=1 Tax=Hyaloscypha bicolor E TaxID=1095630 RepID=A0A2J6SH72_9HELO|nr:uncharacterized protein K444DRAFT_637527 [Hyaloscypha bicolor E]PMD50099.1 hypothetical protein K444DRAFT_637527 [Hyaloscypha bicolor E]
MSTYAESTGPLLHSSTRSSYTPSSPSLSESGTAVESIARSPSTKCDVLPQCGQVFDRHDRQNPEKNLGFPCHGWPALVKLMAESPGFESFQVFRDLNIKSLLYYQAELVSLREKLHEVEWKDHRSGDFQFSDELCARVDFLISTDSGTLKAKTQLTLKLGDFNVRGPGQKSWGDPAAPDPHKRTIGENFVHFLRSVSIFWVEQPKKNHPDLVVPYPRKETDGLTRWVAHDWIPFWHSFKDKFRRNGVLPTTSPASDDEKRRPSDTSSAPTLSQRLSNVNIFGWMSPRDRNGGRIPDERPTLEKYQISGMLKFTSFVTTIAACLLPIVAIAVLATINNDQAKTIGFIALFTGVFAIGLMVLTPSATSRTEIFTATAAFSAVLVVFVQNQGA